LTKELSDSLLVLVCTYNERANLPSLFERINAFVPNAHILVVDDNSPDGTSEWVAEYQRSHSSVLLNRRSGKLGLGTAIREGMHFAIENGYEWLLNLDGDLSHDPKSIPDLLAKRLQSDVVIGSRYVPGGGMVGCSWRRVFVSKCANNYARWLIGWTVHDCSSAFRLYRVAKLKTLNLDGLKGVGYGFLEEVLWHLLNQGARLSEVGIVYSERREGKSKISIKEAWSTITSLHSVASLQRASRNASGS
jgi:dolichol-phosphate mannosyltransferase